jgi:hypothetical protein
MAGFKELIADLSDRLGADLFPDLNNVVTLIVEKRVKFNIEADSVGEFMILGATISELPPGKFRENILKDALKANSRINVNPGVLSYLGRENTLILHTKLFIQGTSVDEIIKEMKHLTSRAKKWMDAIDEGRASPDEEIPKKVGLSGKGMFGF